MSELDPLKPIWLDDKHALEKLNEYNHSLVKDIMDEIKFKDGQRDHSKQGLTADERQEISLFHSLKQDPYYKHHLRTHLSQFADEMSENILSVPHGPYDVDPNDHVKFDRINLYDFRRTLP